VDAVRGVVDAVSKSGLKLFATERGVYVLGDARQVLKMVPSGSIDAIITDPPWGVGFDEYDDFQAFLDVRDELYRVLRDNSWLVFYFTPKRIYDVLPYARLFEYRWMMPYLFESYGILYADELPVVAEKVREPQFKPTYTTSVLLTMFTREGDVVLDPFAGYGSIPLVCELFGRRWIAIEIDPVKFAVAERIIREKRVVSIKRLKRGGGGRAVHL
jgi:DNA modification methylase